MWLSQLLDSSKNVCVSSKGKHMTSILPHLGGRQCNAVTDRSSAQLQLYESAR